MDIWCLHYRTVLMGKAQQLLLTALGEREYITFSFHIFTFWLC